MTLLSPWGLAALGLLPLVLIIYLLQGLRRRSVVPSVFLWRGLARQVTARARWRRPPPDVLLLLQLSIIALGAMALARPGISSPPGRHLVLVLDASASMLAADGGEGGPGPEVTRFAEARRIAARMIAQSGARDEVTIIRAGPSPTILASGNDRGALQKALDDAYAGGGRASIRQAVLLAASVAADKPGMSSQIVVISDGAYPAVRGLASLPASVRFIPVGRGTNNQAVADVSARRAMGGSGKLAGFAAIVNLSDQPADVPAAILADGVPLETRQVHLEPRSRSHISFALPPQTHLVGVALGHRDLLPADNMAETAVETTSDRRVLLVSATPDMLERALRSIPGVRVDVVAPSNYDGAGADLVVLDSFLPSRLPTSPLLIVHPPAGTPFFAVYGELDGLQATDFDPSSPLLASVDLAAQRFSRVAVMDPPAWSLVVAHAGSVPLVLSGQMDGRRAVVLTFDPSRSNLDRMVAFPLLLANAVAWATGGSEVASLRPGDSLVLVPPEKTSRVEVQRPDGTVGEAEVKNGVAVWRDTERVGRYIARAFVDGESQVLRTFVVSVRDEVESDIAPADHPELEIDGYSAPPSEGPPMEVWPWIAGLVISLLGTEWWYFSRHG